MRQRSFRHPPRLASCQLVGCSQWPIALEGAHGTAAQPAQWWPPDDGRRLSTKNSPPSMICLGGCPSSIMPHHTCGQGQAAASTAAISRLQQAIGHQPASHNSPCCRTHDKSAPITAYAQPSTGSQPKCQHSCQPLPHQRIVIWVAHTHNALGKLRGHNNGVVLGAKRCIQPASW